MRLRLPAMLPGHVLPVLYGGDYTPAPPVTQSREDFPEWRYTQLGEKNIRWRLIQRDVLRILIAEGCVFFILPEQMEVVFHLSSRLSPWVAFSFWPGRIKMEALVDRWKTA